MEFHPIWRLALRVQDFLHQDIEEKLDSAEENNTYRTINYSVPTPPPPPQPWEYVTFSLMLYCTSHARLSKFYKEKSNY